MKRPLKLKAALEAQRITRENWRPDYFPVDPFAVAESMGIECRVQELPEGVSGAITKREADNTVVVLVERREPPTRQRFTLAHELGHYVDGMKSTHIDYRNKQSAAGKDPREIFANAFAAELLMPAKAVRRLVQSGLSESEIANAFGVSLSALETRLASLRTRE